MSGGSSREHAPWALLDHGFKVIIAPSFADIFYNNCFSKRDAPIAFSHSEIDEMFEIEKQPRRRDVDLESLELTYAGKVIRFELDASKQQKLLEGIDDIGWTLSLASSISSYEKNRKPSYALIDCSASAWC